MKSVIKQILQIMKKHTAALVLIAGACLLCMAESFFHPLILQKLTDEGLLQREYGRVAGYACLLIILILAVQGLEALQDWLLLRVRNDVLHTLHVQAFQKVLRLKIGQFTKQNSTELIHQLNTDIESAGVLLDKGVLYLFTYSLRIVSGLIGLFFINWKMALCILVCVPVKFVFLHILSKKKEEQFQNYIQENQSFHAWMSDRISGIREIKLQNRYQKEEKQFSCRKEKLLCGQQKINMLDIFHSSAEAGIQGIMTGIYYLLGGYFVCNGSMSMGSVLAFISYSGNVTGPISMLMNIKMIVAQIRPSFKRLNEFWNLDTEQIWGSKLEQEFRTMELQRVCFGYGKKPVIRNASMQLRRGQRVAVVGDNGSGKSTLIQLLLRFYEPDSGEVLVNGKNSRAINLEEYRALFSVVSQFPYLFQETVRENLDYEGRYTDEELKAVFRETGMEELLAHFPQGLDTVIGVSGTNVSGGEKQKLAFLRAMLHLAPVLIFDECTSNFDHESEEWFFTEGLELLGDKLVILITHQLKYVENCDKIYEIRNGKIEERKAIREKSSKRKKQNRRRENAADC